MRCGGAGSPELLRLLSEVNPEVAVIQGLGRNARLEIIEELAEHYPTAAFSPVPSLPQCAASCSPSCRSTDGYPAGITRRGSRGLQRSSWRWTTPVIPRTGGHVGVDRVDPASGASGTVRDGGDRGVKRSEAQLTEEAGSGNELLDVAAWDE